MTEVLTPSQIEFGRKIFSGECNFIRGIADHDGLLDMSHPEIAFAGRSNVGKSSLINALTRQNNLARTSHTPGRTQELNIFELAQSLYIVDLPGYGYAKASKTKIKAWNSLIRDYLRGRRTLQRVCVLIDSRHGLKKVDLEIMDMLDEVAVTYMVVLTKIDKVKDKMLEQRRTEITETLSKRPAAYPNIFATSSAKGYGLPELRAMIAGFVA